ncbi:MAG: ABC transporter permease [Phycisphaerales bacterium]|jgi:putative ABC transport system permease protein
MVNLWHDIKCGIRQLRKSPGFTIVAVLTLALGIGANITMFSFFNAYLLRPLPYQDTDRIVTVREEDRKTGDRPPNISYADYLDWAEHNQCFEALACYGIDDYTLTYQDSKERLGCIKATGNLLSMLDVKPVAGRLFRPEDDQPQAERTVILSHALWQRRFGGSTDVLGESILLNDLPYTVIGVLPASFAFPSFRRDPVDLWTPMAPMAVIAGNEWFAERGNYGGTTGIGKLKAGVSLQQARAEMDRVARQLEQANPRFNTNKGIFVGSFHHRLVANVKPTMLLLMGAVACVLLIVCVNIANLVLIRSAVRNQEFAVRSALGAGRWRLFRQLFCESMLLAVLGGIGGLILAFWSLDILGTILPDNLSHPDGKRLLMDGPMVLFLLGATMGTAMIFGLLPALRSSRVVLSRSYWDTARSVTAGPGSHRLRNALVISEMALALILLVGAGLLLRSFVYYLRSDPGFDSQKTLVMNLDLPKRIGQYPPQKQDFYRELVQQIQPIAGVEYVGAASNILGHWGQTYYVEGSPILGPGEASGANIGNVTPAFFQSMGIPLLEGRFFTEHDQRDAALVAIIDEKLARRWWPNESPIGKRIQRNGRPDPNDSWYEVVGVVGHIKYDGVDREAGEYLYFSAYQSVQTFWDSMTLVVRSDGDPMRLAGGIGQAIAAVDQEVTTGNIRTLQTIVGEQSFMRRLITTVLGLFAITALVLSALGIYGVMAYSMSQRTHEIGIRVALGASEGNIIRMTLRQGIKLVLVGVSLGLIGALVLTRLLTGFLFGVSSRDPITLFTVIGVLVIIALLACYVPARRAAKTNPMEALRYE